MKAGMTDGMKGTAGIRIILGFITPFYSVITLYYSVVNPTEGSTVMALQ